MKQKILSILAILLGLMPGMSLTAYAEGTTVDLSTLTGNYTAADGDVLSGSVSDKSVTIPTGATVTLNGVNITNGNITCQGNATIILVGDNTVTAQSNKTAVQAGGTGTTLTITGTGSLTANGGDDGAGIGAGTDWVMESYGDITITGGTINATGKRAAGIGGVMDYGCGNITISGGTVTATSDYDSAGIGGGWGSSCGNITITDAVTKVVATKGTDATYIGAGHGGSCGTVTIDGVANATTSSTFEHFVSEVSGSTWTLTNKAPAAVNVTANEGASGEYWATYYNGTVSYTADANTTVYQAAVNGTKTGVTLTEVTGREIPAGNAVILKSTVASITLTPATTTATLSGNELQGTDAELTTPANAYCLSKETTGSARGVGFYTYTLTSIPAHRAYLVVSGGPAATRGFLGFGDDNTTGISLPEAVVIEDDAPVYDLSGRRVTGQPQKGIYVKNGKKFVIK